MLARDTTLWSDDVWLADSTPVGCARSRDTVTSSELAGFAEYGYCASRSRYFSGLRLHLLATVHGLPVGFALTGAKADERQTLLAILTADPDLAGRVNQTLIADKNYYGRDFEAALPDLGIRLLRPTRAGEPERPGARFFTPLRQIIESINDTGVLVSVWQRLLAHRPDRQTITDRLRPLTRLGITHPGAAPPRFRRNGTTASRESDHSSLSMFKA